jgi:hypothetical protein
MSWTDKNHPLILITLSAKAAPVFSQLIRRGAKCRKEQETRIREAPKLEESAALMATISILA